MKHHVQQRGTRGEFEVFIWVPAKHERGGQQRKIRGVLLGGGDVAEGSEKGDGVLHWSGGDLLEAEEEVAVSSDKKLTGLQSHVPERDAGTNEIDVQRQLCAGHSTMTTVGAIHGGRHQLSAPAHEDESARIGNFGGARDFVDDDSAAELESNRHTLQVDWSVSGGVSHHQRHVHLTRGGGTTRRRCVDSANAHEIFGRKGRPRRDGKLECTRGEVRALRATRRRRRSGGGGGGGFLQQSSRGFFRPGSCRKGVPGRDVAGLRARRQR